MIYRFKESLPSLKEVIGQWKKQKCEWRHNRVISAGTKRARSYGIEEGKHLFLGLVSVGFLKKAVICWAESCVFQSAPRVADRIRQARGRKW